MDQNAKKQAVAKAAIEYVENGGIVGVGTGSTVNFFIEELGKIKNNIEGAVSSSDASNSLFLLKLFQWRDLLWLASW